jgi:hypothetical protein
MELSDFLHFNARCPVCDNSLTLYMQWIDSVCFKAKKSRKNIYTFEQFKCKNTEDLPLSDFIELYDYGNTSEIKFSSSKIASETRRKQMYFFYLCNDNGFESTGEDNYEINMTPGCYYRATPIVEFHKKSRNKWDLQTINKDHSKLVNNDEALVFMKNTNGTEKVYMLQFDYSNNKTKFMHYSATEEQLWDKSYEPNIFEKEIIDLSIRPNFSLDNREKLINRFESWIIMS